MAVNISYARYAAQDGGPRTRREALHRAYATLRSRERFREDFYDLVRTASMRFVAQEACFEAYCDAMRVEVEPHPHESLAVIRAFPQVTRSASCGLDMDALVRFAHCHVIETSEAHFDGKGNLCLQTYLVMPQRQEDDLDDIIAQLVQDGADLRQVLTDLEVHQSLVRAACALAELHAEHEGAPWHPGRAQRDQCCLDSRLAVPSACA